MDNQLFTLSKIFTERILRIPDYQRGYAWTEKQVKDFWNDLIQLEEDRNHYTGVLTLENVSPQIVDSWVDDHWIIKSKKYNPFYIVDGQQRLTTSIILIKSILESVPSNKRLNYTTLEDIKKKFIYDSKDDGISRSYIFGYEKDNPSYEFLKTRIFGQYSDVSFSLQETIYTRNLEEAKIYFTKMLGALDYDAIQNLYTKLTQNFLFNIYTIDKDVDVYIAFETMNNRGKPLSILELLKNRLIYLSTRFDADATERQTLRKAINESWKSIYKYLGKNKQKPLGDDEFLTVHFKIHYKTELLKDSFKNRIEIRTETNIIQEYLLESRYTANNVIKEKLKLNEIYAYVKSLKQSVEIWYYLFNPSQSNFSSEEIEWLEKLNRLPFIFFAPLILSYFLKVTDTTSRINFLSKLERLIFLNSLLSTTYTNDFLMSMEKMSAYKIPLDEIHNSIDKRMNSVYEIIKDGIGKASLFPEGDFYSWRNLKYFLFEYETDLKNQSKTYREKLNWDVFKEDSRDFTTVEHIYPQNDKRPCWRDLFEHFNNREKLALKHTLGNLVPLSRPKNSSFGNACFESKKGDADKMVGYIYGSYSENEVAANDIWTAKEIVQRGLKMLDFMEKRWELKFGDENDKIKLLGLDFLNSDGRRIGTKKIM